MELWGWSAEVCCADGRIEWAKKDMSGLDRSKKILSHLKEVSVVDFDHSDVVRHPLVSKIVKAYNNNDKS